ncbi:MAG: hypothetical protein ACKV19_16575, partial [Verrucomicrobiales bacterium]
KFLHPLLRPRLGLSLMIWASVVTVVPKTAAQSTPSMIGDRVTVKSFSNPGGTSVEVVDSGVLDSRTAEYVAGGAVQTDYVNIGVSTIYAQINPSGSTQFLGAAGGDVFEITGIDDANDIENSVIVNVEFISPIESRGVTAKTLEFSDSRGVDSGTVRFEVEGVFDHPGFIFSALWPRWTLEVTFMRLQPLVILASKVDLEQNRISVTWASQQGRTYNVAFSNDLQRWTTVLRGIQAGESPTTRDFSIPPGANRQGFFRVEEVPGG